MIANVLTVGQQVLILFILILVGFCMGKKKIIGDEAIGGMANMVLYIVTPAVIINAFRIPYEPSKLGGLALTALITIIVHVITISVVSLTVHHEDKSRECILKFSIVFSNCGYMALPLEQALLGSNGVFYGSAFVAIFNILLWTWGEGLMRGEFKFTAKSLILNPGIMGTLIGFILFFASIPLPEFLGKPVEYIAALNTPIPMMIIGYQLSKSFVALKHPLEYICIAMRLVIIPLASLASFIFIGLKGDYVLSSFIAISAPVAAAGTMFAEKYNHDTGLSAALVSISTLLSILTMPLIIGIARFYLI